MNIDNIYGSRTPLKSPHYTEPEPLMSEDDVRQRMSDISRRHEPERQALRDAYAALAKREAQVQLAITFMRPELFYKFEAKQMMEEALEKKLKLYAADKEAIIMLELEELKTAHDLLKFDCDTSDGDFKKLEPQLSFYQSLLKLR